MCGRLRRNGFTLIELLLVITILGILAVIAAPRAASMLAGGTLRMGARELASAGRYARTMALLNQTPVDLTFTQGKGGFKVSAHEAITSMTLGMSDVEALTNDVGYTESLLQTSARRDVSLSGGFGLAISEEDRDDMDWDEDSSTNALSVLKNSSGDIIADTVSFEDSVNMERETQGVTLWFDGYQDRVGTVAFSAVEDMREDTFSAVEGDSVVIRYRANGTVRPYEIIVRNENDEDDTLRIVVNAVGTVKIRGTEDD